MFAKFPSPIRGGPDWRAGISGSNGFNPYAGMKPGGRKPLPEPQPQMSRQRMRPDNLPEYGPDSYRTYLSGMAAQTESARRAFVAQNPEEAARFTGRYGQDPSAEYLSQNLGMTSPDQPMSGKDFVLDYWKKYQRGMNMPVAVPRAR